MKELLIVFVKNPIKGQVKSRLANSIGKSKALSVYKKLLIKTKDIVLNLKIDRRISYLDKIINTDLWESHIFQKSVQVGETLGDKMFNAVKDGIDDGYSNICLIGSDSMELTDVIINSAFDYLDRNDVVLGPSKDGGYYLVGMKSPLKSIFSNISWSTELVLKQTIIEIEKLDLSYKLLSILNDIDVIDDINESDRDYLLS